MINYAGFVASLEIMWKGMAGLFVVCIFIMLLVMVLKHFMRKGDSQPGSLGSSSEGNKTSD